MFENGESVSENGFSQTNHCLSPINFSMGIELQQQLGLNIEHLSSTHTPYIQEMGHDLNKALPYDDQQNWENEMTYTTFTTQNPNPQAENLQYIDMQNGHQSYLNASSLSDFMTLYPQSLLAKSSSPFVNQPLNPGNFSEILGSNLVYEPRDMFHQGVGSGSSLIGGMEEREGWEYEIGEGSNKVGSRGKCIVTKTKEKIRREQVNDKFKALRSLLPNPEKNDKASIIAEAIEYIKELLRTKGELKILEEQKRRGGERNKRQKSKKDTGGNDGFDIKPEPYNNSGSSALRSSWLQRKSKGTEVDVRIVDDDVTIRLAQKKKTNCLLIVTKALDELQLDIDHVAGGLVGDNFSFLFNTKICEGSCVYASAIANKIIEVVDKQYAAIQQGTNF